MIQIAKKELSILHLSLFLRISTFPKFTLFSPGRKWNSALVSQLAFCKGMIRVAKSLSPRTDLAR